MSLDSSPPTRARSHSVSRQECAESIIFAAKSIEGKALEYSPYLGDRAEGINGVDSYLDVDDCAAQLLDARDDLINRARLLTGDVIEEDRPQSFITEPNPIAPAVSIGIIAIFGAAFGLFLIKQKYKKG